MLALLLPRAGEAVAESIGAKFAPADVTNTDQIEAALDLVESFGHGAVNTLVNCAGICPGVRTFHPKKGPHPYVSGSVVHKPAHLTPPLLPPHTHTSARHRPCAPARSWLCLPAPAAAARGRRLEIFQKTLDVNVAGTFNVLRLGTARMAGLEAEDGQRGVIVNTASIAAMDGKVVPPLHRYLHPLDPRGPKCVRTRCRVLWRAAEGPFS